MRLELYAVNHLPGKCLGSIDLRRRLRVVNRYLRMLLRSSTNKLKHNQPPQQRETERGKWQLTSQGIVSRRMIVCSSTSIHKILSTRLPNTICRPSGDQVIVMFSPCVSIVEVGLEPSVTLKHLSVCAFLTPDQSRETHVEYPCT